MNILTVGNSFSSSLDGCFRPVTSRTGHPAHLEHADFGGCELARHWSYIEAEERDPICRIHQGCGAKLRDILTRTDWHVISIQQASHESWKSESYEPHAEKLIGYLRKYAPLAEILLQQTWSYRADHPAFAPENGWGISQKEMDLRLARNYKTLAHRHGLRMIPTGLAVRLAREAENAPYQVSKSNENPIWPDLPRQSGDVVGRSGWRRDPDGRMRLWSDRIHLNDRGEYLQAWVWAFFLFGTDLTEHDEGAERIDADDAAQLRAVARCAVQTPFDAIT